MKNQKGRRARFEYLSDPSDQAVKDAVILVPFTTLAVYPFDYPFSGAAQIRDAVRLKVRALFGENLSKLFLVPLIMKKKGKGASGVAFLLMEEESLRLEKTLNSGDSVYWPLPLVFASKVEGTGLILWGDENRLCTLWLDDWIPQLYRCSPREPEDIERERALCEEYAKSLGKEIGSVFIREEPDHFGDDLQQIAAKTLLGCPAYGSLDLSPKGADVAEQRERLWGTLTSFSRRMAAVGLVFLLVSALAWGQRHYFDQGVSSLPKTVYARSFGEKSNNPARSARQKVEALTDSREGQGFTGLMKIISAAWTDNQDQKLRLDSMRYTDDKTDIQGTADDAGSIQNLRESIAKNQLDVKAGDIQQIPGGGFRFSLSIQEEKQ